MVIDLGVEQIGLIFFPDPIGKGPGVGAVPLLQPRPASRAFRGAVQAQRYHHQHCGRRQKCHPGRLLLPLKDVFHPPGGVMFPKGQGHGSGTLRRVFHQRKAVPPFGLVPQRVQHRLVAAHLQIPAKEHPAKPHGGIPPVDRHNAPRQQLPPGVPAADMVALMGQNAGALHPRKARTDIDAGAEETQDKGRGDLRALPHFTAGPYRLGHPAFEPHHPHCAPKEHRQGPQQPYR